MLYLKPIDCTLKDADWKAKVFAMLCKNYDVVAVYDDNIENLEAMFVSDGKGLNEESKLFNSLAPNCQFFHVENVGTDKEVKINKVFE